MAAVKEPTLRAPPHPRTGHGIGVEARAFPRSSKDIKDPKDIKDRKD